MNKIFTPTCFESEACPGIFHEGQIQILVEGGGNIFITEKMSAPPPPTEISAHVAIYTIGEGEEAEYLGYMLVLASAPYVCPHEILYHQKKNIWNFYRGHMLL
jgi:hypothetical protein